VSQRIILKIVRFYDSAMHNNHISPAKGGFFSESAIHFSDLQISKKKELPKNYPELEI
jgi:hypothetical protein